MNRMKNRVVILMAAITIVAAMLACSTGRLVSRREGPTATPTKTPKPTFTVTLTPTLTPIPTDTPQPTLTPFPTDTPAPTATFTPLPTDTPIVPTDTPVPAPTARPTSRPRPRPTATPKPPPKPQPTQAPQYAWTGQVSNTFQNCGLTRVFGFTLANNGGLAGDIWVHYWADGWNGAWAKSGWSDFGSGTTWKGDEGNWDGTIDSKARDGTWHVCVVPDQGSWDCASNKVDVTTSSNCSSGAQSVQITFRKN